MPRMLGRDDLRTTMANPQRRREQITVPLDADLRAELERLAAQEHRTLAGQVRHLMVKALEEVTA
jgi:hypothetical protein